jgi:RimK family alpha-L-glutamate ligase
MRIALVACRATPTNAALVAAGSAGSWELLSPERALAELRPGDAALGRLDVLPTLDGVDDGLWALGALAARGVAVLNDPSALLATHDKLLTARLLQRHGLPHPRTYHVRARGPLPLVAGETVVKPRFGSWGHEVVRCAGREELVAHLAFVREAPWVERHGALVQELVPPQGYDLRIVVAGGRVVGAVNRIAADGEWRTNVALGGVRRPTQPPRGAALLALEAAFAAGAALVGVDLVPDGCGGWTILELNGAVEFTREYATWGDVFAEAAGMLERVALDRRAGAALAAL